MAILTRLSDPAIDAFLRSFPTLGARTASRGIEAGTVNTSYALDLASGRYFLRLYEEQDLDGAAREAELLSHLSSSGVPTPAPIAGEDGAFVRLLEGRPAALFPWVDGDILCQKRVTPEAARIVGAALARIHVAGGPCGAGRFHPEAIIERSAGITDAALRDELRERVVAVAALRRADLPSGLVHGDLFRDNVLWNEGKIAALLDFESAHHGPFIFDVAVTVLSWSYSSELELPILRAIADGYQSVRRFTDAERLAFFDEATFAALRFTITRITDDAIRVGKKWQRFVERREALAAIGRKKLAEALAS